MVIKGEEYHSGRLALALDSELHTKASLEVEGQNMNNKGRQELFWKVRGSEMQHIVYQVSAVPESVKCQP